MYNQRGDLAASKGDFITAQQKYELALSHFQVKQPIDKTYHLMLLHKLAMSYRRTSNINKASEKALLFLENYTEESRIGKFNLGEMYLIAGRAQLLSRNNVEAIKYLEMAVNILQNEPMGADAFSVAILELGKTQLAQNNFNAAEQTFIKGRRTIMNHHKPNHVALVNINFHLGVSLVKQNRKEDAKTYFEKNLEIVNQNSPNDLSGTFDSLLRLLKIEKDQGRNKYALKYFEHLLALESNPRFYRVNWLKLRKEYNDLLSEAK